jgi:hypothetical protein
MGSSFWAEAKPMPEQRRLELDDVPWGWRAAQNQRQHIVEANVGVGRKPSESVRLRSADDPDDGR